MLGFLKYKNKNKIIFFSFYTIWILFYFILCTYIIETLGKCGHVPNAMDGRASDYDINDPGVSRS